MELARSLLAMLRAYASNPDPRVAAGNTVALIVAYNQPFYPLYLYWLVSDRIALSFLTFLSTPFFLAVPALSRRHPVAGRALLPLAGIANTVLCAKVFGVASAVEMFLIPCAVLALLLFRTGERLVSYGIAGLAFLAYQLLHGSYGAPIASYTASEYAALANLNAVSAGALAAVTALIFSNVLAASEGGQR